MCALNPFISTYHSAASCTDDSRRKCFQPGSCKDSIVFNDNVHQAKAYSTWCS